MTAYLPLVGIAGGIAFCRGRRSHPFTYIMKACILCAFVPVLNSAFYALNSSYYARWYYMPVLVLCGATAYVLARPHLSEQQVPRAWRVVALVTLSAAAFALVPNTDEEGNFQLGVVDLQPRFWGIFAVSVLGVLLFWVLWKLARNRRGWAKAMLAGVLAFSFFYGTVHLSLTKYPQWGTDSDLIAETYDSVAELDELLPEDAFYRLDAYGAHSNLGLWFDKSCLQFFNSTVAPSIMEFYPEVGVTRDVNSKPDAQNYALRGLLSVRYTLVAKDSADDWDGENLSGWTLCGQTSAYDVYQNDNWVPMGFTYDFYVTKAQLDTVPEKERAQILMRALLLDEEQIETYAGLLDPLPEEELEDRTANRYAEDCADRRAGGVVEFAANRSGFTAHTNYADQELVFFSVPYDDGFTATVNGVPAVIEKVDNGLMAVLVPAGDADIEFTYHTPGLALSARISLAGVAVYGVYLLFLYRTRKRKLNAESC